MIDLVKGKKRKKDSLVDKEQQQHVSRPSRDGLRNQVPVDIPSFTNSSVSSNERQRKS